MAKTAHILVLLVSLPALARGQCDERRIDPTTGTSSRFGTPEIDGDLLAIGDRFDSAQVQSGGIVHLYERGPLGWQFTGLLAPTAPTQSAEFGYAKDLAGDWAVVGAAGADRFHVFDRVGASWIESAVVTGVADSYLGVSVRIDGDAIVAGCTGADNAGGSNAGEVHVYEHDGSTWVRTQTIVASDGSPDALFGAALALDGDRLFVTAARAQRAYVFERAGGAWIESAILDPQITSSCFPSFGWDVAFSDDRLVMSSSCSGPIVFVDSGGGWQLEPPVPPPVATSSFGKAVSLHGDRMLVGAYVAPYFGAAYVYRLAGNTWTLEQELLAPAPHWFGRHVLITEDEAFVAATGFDPGGAVYVYDYACLIGTRYCAATTNSSGSSGRMRVSGSTDVTDEDLVLGADRLAVNQFGYYLTSMGQRFLPMLGGGAGNLCLDLPIVRFAGNILNSGPAGAVELALDLTALPPGTTFSPGDTWSFQYWFRDQNPHPTSNTTDATAVTFQTSGAPSVQFPVALRSEEEETLLFTVLVTLSQPAAVDVSVPYSESGSATPLVDYRVESTNPLVVPAGASYAQLQVVVAEDAETEADEHVTLTLLAPTNGVLGTATSFRLTIVDDD